MPIPSSSARRRRTPKAGEHTYLLAGIPKSVWQSAVAKSAAEHAEVCGSETSHERCPVHAMKAVIVRLLKHWTAGTLHNRL